MSRIVRREDGRVAGVGGCDYASARQEGGDGGTRSAARPHPICAVGRGAGTEYEAKRVRVINGAVPAIGDGAAAHCNRRGRQAGGASARGHLAAFESRPTESAAPPRTLLCAGALSATHERE